MKWNAENVKNIKGMFSKCDSLTSFPNVSQWKAFYLNGNEVMSDKEVGVISDVLYPIQLEKEIDNLN